MTHTIQAGEGNIPTEWVESSDEDKLKYQNPIKVNITNKEDLTLLANARAKLEKLENEKKYLVDLWQSDPEYIQVLEDIKVAKSVLTEIDSEYKNAYLADAHWDHSGKVENPKPLPEVTLKRFDATKVDYEPSKAFEYCLTHLVTCLSLDTKEFEKQAKTGKLPEDIVVVKPGFEIRVQFASDLSEYETDEDEE